MASSYKIQKRYYYCQCISKKFRPFKKKTKNIYIYIYVCVHQGSEFYNSSFKKSLNDNDTEVYSTSNEGRVVVGERFIKTLKYKDYKHMIVVSKNFFCWFFGWYCL